jgi:hypothetical protein
VLALVLTAWFFFDCALTWGRHGAEPQLLDVMLYPSAAVCEAARAGAAEEGHSLYACLPADERGAASAWARCEDSADGSHRWGGL